MNDDTISRQMALDALDDVLVEDESCKVWFKLALKQLPSAERRGRWKYTKELYRDPNGNHLFYGKICSECNSVSPYDSPYCMNCGANMQQNVTLVGAKMNEVEEEDW